VFPEYSIRMFVYQGMVFRREMRFTAGSETSEPGFKRIWCVSRTKVKSK